MIPTDWAWPEQDLKEIFQRAHDGRALVMHMVSGVPEAVRAAEAGADVIVAQGTEGGGHVGWMGQLCLAVYGRPRRLTLAGACGGRRGTVAEAERIIVRRLAGLVTQV